MRVISLDHVQVAMPAHRETEARAFYAGLLGMTEIEKPAHLAVRGGLWFAAGDRQLHLGVEAEFTPARKAHPALLVDDLAGVRAVLRAEGIEPVDDEPLEGYSRCYVNDPFGNRIELLQKT